MAVLNNDSIDDPILDDETVDFRGGAFSAVRKNQLAQNMFSLGKNVIITDDGQLVTRRGGGKVGTDAAGAVPVLGLAYLDTPALEWLVRVIKVGASIQFHKHDSDNATAWQNVALPGGWAIADVPMEIVPALDKVYLFNGVDEVRSWDGAAFAGLGTTATDAPLARLAVWFQYRMFAAGVAAKPDTVFFCDVLDPSAGKWSHVAKSFRVGAGEGDDIVSLAKWVKTYLAVLKRSSLWVANVDPTIALGGNIAQDCVHDKIGCLSHRSVRRVGNDLFFLSDDGVRSMQQSIADGATSQISAPISAPLQDLFNRVNKNAASTACAEVFGARYLIALPIDNATQPNVVACYNSTFKVWEGYWSGVLPTVFCTSVFGGIKRLNWGQSDGRVLQWRDWVLPANETGTDYQDDATDIASTMGLRSHNFGEAKNDKKGFVLELEFNESRAAEVTVKAYRDESNVAEVLGTITSGLGSGITFPLTFPLTFPAQGVKREPMPLDDLAPFREVAIEVSAPSGKLALRAARLSAFLETMSIGR